MSRTRNNTYPLSTVHARVSVNNKITAGCDQRNAKMCSIFTVVEQKKFRSTVNNIKVKCPILLSGFKQIWIICTHFRKSPMSNENPGSGPRAGTDGQLRRSKLAISLFMPTRLKTARGKSKKILNIMNVCVFSCLSF